MSVQLAASGNARKATGLSPRPSAGERSRGQALVELALILPVLVLLILILVDFGRAVYAWSAVSNAAREGARVAIVDQGTTGGVSNAALVAARQATALGIDATDPSAVDIQYLMPDLGSSCPSRAIGCVARVRVSYGYVPSTPFIDRIVGSISLVGMTEIPVERTNP